MTPAFQPPARIVVRFPVKSVFIIVYQWLILQFLIRVDPRSSADPLCKMIPEAIP